MKKAMLFYLSALFTLVKIGCIFLIGFYAQTSSASSSSEFIIEQFVDQMSAAHIEFLKVRGEINDLNRQIRVLRGRDPINLIKRKSVREDNYYQQLQGRATTYTFDDEREVSLFYKGDDLWYYRALKNPYMISCLENHPIHGPCVKRLESNVSVSSLRLKNPFVYLASFNQIENICGFAALANAAALEAQAQAGRPITFAETRNLAETSISTVLAPVMGDLSRDIEGRIEYAGQEVLSRGATRLNLDGIVEYLDKGAVENLHKRLQEGRHMDRNVDLEKRISGNRNLHIVYNVGGCHWVNLSLIKDATGNRCMFLLDSSNAPLKNENDVIVLIRYIDELIERVFLQQALNEPSMQIFNELIKKHKASQPKLLEKLMKRYVDIAPADTNEKKLLHDKIDAVTTLLNIGDLPKTMHVFLRDQSSQKGCIWPKNLQTLMASAKNDKSSKKKHSPIVEKKEGKKLFFGLLLGASTFVLLLWLKHARQKKESKDISPIRSQGTGAFLSN